jgi:hypothetical protein
MPVIYSTKIMSMYSYFKDAQNDVFGSRDDRKHYYLPDLQRDYFFRGGVDRVLNDANPIKRGSYFLYSRIMKEEKASRCFHG